MVQNLKKNNNCPQINNFKFFKLKMLSPKLNGSFAMMYQNKKLIQLTIVHTNVSK